jgi:hypothetical protein
MIKNSISRRNIVVAGCLASTPLYVAFTMTFEYNTSNRDAGSVDESRICQRRSRESRSANATRLPSRTRVETIDTRVSGLYCQGLAKRITILRFAHQFGMILLFTTKIDNDAREVACNELEVTIKRGGAFVVFQPVPYLLLASLHFQSTVKDWMASVAKASLSECWWRAMLTEGIIDHPARGHWSANQSQGGLRICNASRIKSTFEQKLVDA